MEKTNCSPQRGRIIIGPDFGPTLTNRFHRRAAAVFKQSWVILTSGTLIPRPTVPALAPAECVETLMPSSGSMASCVADNASVATPRKSGSSSTAEEVLHALRSSFYLQLKQLLKIMFLLNLSFETLKFCFSMK
ncbi:hypothetical protein V6N11_033653 [Hibiscus sabdariffa]|uniref:Uncharacterized protein n=1 Tax=Hibiscus sabdariffa TaxID=183260 RepID=A0ABR2PZ58_9ROSI